MKRKDVDDVLGGPETWANVDKTDGMSIGPMNSESMLEDRPEQHS